MFDATRIRCSIVSVDSVRDVRRFLSASTARKIVQYTLNINKYGETLQSSDGLCQNDAFVSLRVARQSQNICLALFVYVLAFGRRKVNKKLHYALVFGCILYALQDAVLLATFSCRSVSTSFIAFAIHALWYNTFSGEANLVYVSDIFLVFITT